MRFDPENNRVLVRQSWLGDALLCPQRSRYALALPSMRRGSDYTAIGTGVHHGIELYLTGEVSDFSGFLENIQSSVHAELEKDIKRTEVSSNMEKMNACVDAMATAWWDDIRPYVPKGGLVEHRFSVPTGMTLNDGTEIWYEGTIDYVAPDGVLWDWKTSSRPYYVKDKQAHAHQPTVYAYASQTLGLIPADKPAVFRFGVMVRQEKPKAQIATVIRDRGQIDWILRQTRSVVETSVASWGKQDWMINDTHTLCSSKWCDYWTLCKGAHWTDSDLSLPDQTVTPVDVTP